MKKCVPYFFAFGLITQIHAFAAQNHLFWQPVTGTLKETIDGRDRDVRDQVACARIADSIRYVNPDVPTWPLPEGLFCFQSKQRRIADSARYLKTPVYCVEDGKIATDKPFIWDCHQRWFAHLAPDGIEPFYPAIQSADPTPEMAAWRKRENAKLSGYSKETDKFKQRIEQFKQAADGTCQLLEGISKIANALKGK